jgi:glycosyltransferase involved in cell wall biosynthesis
LSHTLLIIPAYNEGATLSRVLERVRDAALGCEVVVVDDGSSDDTAAVARSTGATVLSHPFNLGYGAALQTGYKYALSVDAELLLQMDADGQHDPAQLAALAQPIRDDELDIVIGSRFIGESDYEMEALRSVGRWLFTTLARLAGLHVSDPTSGFQAMNRHVVEVYSRDSFPTDYPDVDVLLGAYRHGLRVGERPAAMAKAERASTLHGGLRPVYYVYKMLLSTWASSASKRGRPVQRKTADPKVESEDRA